MGRRTKIKRDIQRKTGDKSGYIYTYVPDHPKAFGTNTHNAGYYYKHIIMMEKILGRYLKSDETVKFKDDNRFNCTPDNLYVVTAIPREGKYKKYLWITLCYISENMFCSSTNICDYLSGIYDEFNKLKPKSQSNTVYSCIDYLRRKGLVKLDKIGQRVVGWRSTKKGIKESVDCVMDGRSHKVVLDHIINVLE